MKNKIGGISQQFKIDNGLSLSDVFVLSWIGDVFRIDKVYKITIDGVVYKWLKYDQFLEDYPGAVKTKKTLWGMMSKYVELGILKREVQNRRGGKFAYFAPGDRWDEAFFLDNDNPDIIVAQQDPQQSPQQSQQPQPQAATEPAPAQQQPQSGSFDEFLGLFGKATRRDEAAGIWASLSTDDQQKAIAAAPGYHGQFFNGSKDIQYHKNPASWLNERSWEAPIVLSPEEIAAKEAAKEDEILRRRRERLAREEAEAAANRKEIEEFKKSNGGSVGLLDAFAKKAGIVIKKDDDPAPVVVDDDVPDEVDDPIEVDDPAPVDVDAPPINYDLLIAAQEKAKHHHNALSFEDHNRKAKMRPINGI